MKVILAGHGSLGKSMKESVEMVFGKVDNFYSVEFHKGEGIWDLVSKYRNIINNNEQALVVVDLFGGSPYNAASIIASENGLVEVVSGMSLALCLDIAVMCNENDAKSIIDNVKKSVQEYTRSYRDSIVFESEDDF